MRHPSLCVLFFNNVVCKVLMIRRDNVSRFCIDKRREYFSSQHRNDREYLFKGSDRNDISIGHCPATRIRPIQAIHILLPDVHVLDIAEHRIVRIISEFSEPGAVVKTCSRVVLKLETPNVEE